MPNLASVQLTADDRNAIVRAMVQEIGSEPQQDLHYDYWHYADQQELWGFEQSYQQAIIRKFVALKFGDDASLAVTGPMDLFMAACRTA